MRWYGILIALGFLLGVLYAFSRCKAMGLDSDRLLDAVVVGLIGAIICARLYYCVFYDGGQVLERPFEDLRHPGGGPGHLTAASSARWCSGA